MAYTPPLGFAALTPLYDRAIASLTRERAWRTSLAEHLSAKPGETILDAVSRNLLQHLTARRDDPVFAFLRQVSVDQAAIVQITPECMDIFNAAVVMHPKVTYGCVVTGAPAPPSSLALRPESLTSPERVALGGLFMGVWFLATSVGNFISGRVSGLYEAMPLPSLFGTIAAIAIVFGVVLMLLTPAMRRLTQQAAR